MPKRKVAGQKPEILKGWQQIAGFLGQPVSVAQRWATDGMPVKIVTPQSDIGAELKRGLAFIRKQRATRRKNAA
jgi:hypothetical protein